jgi:hypothetical protein
MKPFSLQNPFDGQPPFSFHPEKATEDELIGFACTVNGKDYILSQDELVFDSETREVVYDPRIYNKVFDRYEEALTIANTVRRKSKELAHGGKAKRQLFGLHPTFSGLPQDSDESEDRAA